MKKILMMLLVLLGLGMAACSLEGFGGGNNNKPEHKHSIVEGWKNDSANHWQLCDSCDEKINFGAHEFGEWTKVEGLDLEIRSCACGWEEQRNTTPTNKDLTVYYYNTQNWTEVAAYAWDSVETKVLGDWPGSLMTAETDGWYTITISATSLDDLKIIFNSHQAENASQTPDIELDSDYVYFYGLNTEGFASKEDAIAAYEEEQEVAVVYTVEINGTSHVLALNTNNQNDVEYFVKGIALNEGEKLVVKLNGEDVEAVADPYAANNLTSEMTIRQSTTNAEHGIYVKVLSNGYQVWVDGYVAPEVPGEKQEVIVYYYNSLNWTTINAYSWNTSGELLGTWPGFAMTAEENGWYTIKFETGSLEGLGLIFNNGSEQTKDIALDVEKVYFYGINTTGFASKEEALAAYDAEQETPVETTTVYLNPYQWNSNDAWYWVHIWDNDGSANLKMTDEDADGIFEVKVPVNYNKIIFVRANPACTEPKWNNETETENVWNQSADLDMPADSKVLYIVFSWEEGAWAPLHACDLVDQKDETNHWKFCDECDLSFGIEEHKFENFVSNSDSTCTKNGTETATCSCGETKTQEDADSMLNHVAKEAWEKDDNNHWHLCQNCETAVELDKAPHVYGEWVEKEPATETETGLKERSCTCGHIQTEEIPVLAHTHKPSTDYSSDGTYHWLTCSGCSERLSEGKHEGGEATYTELAVCSTCGKEYGSVLPTVYVTIYFNPVEWATANPLYWIHTWYGEYNEQIEMVEVEETGIYTAKLPSHYDGFVVVRANPENSTVGDWNGKWNQTVNLTIPTDENNMLLITGWGDESTEGNSTAKWVEYHTCSEKASLKANDTQHYYECSVCGLTSGYENHKGGTATTTEKAVCEVCNTPYGSLLEETPIETHYYLLGTMNGWSAKDDYKLVLNGTSASIKVTLTNGDAFKVAYDDYSKEFGYSSDISLEGKLTGTNGQNIEVAQAGEYTITVSGLDSDTHTLSIVCDKVLENKIEHATYYLVGSLNGEDFWNFTGADRILAVENGVASISYKFATNDEFKIAAEGWNPEFGYSNELDSTYFSASGTNIKVKFAGTYLIEVTYSTDGSKDTLKITPSDDVKVLEPTSVLYLKPNNNWNVDNARFAAYFFGNGTTWVSMELVDENTYKCDVPTGYSSVIFCRMNPSTTDNNWNNKYNQTGDLTIPSDGTNLCTINEGQWDCGTNLVWSTYTHVHTPLEDDGDCTTAIVCKYCSEVTTAAKETHTISNNVCSVCGMNQLTSSNSEAITITDNLITIVDPELDGLVSYYVSNVDLSGKVYVSLKYKVDGITSYNMLAEGMDANGELIATVASVPGGWNFTRDAYTTADGEVIIVTAQINHYLTTENSFTSVKAIVFSFEADANATFEILDFAVTTDGKHGFEIPEEVIEGPYTIKGVNTTQEGNVFKMTTNRPELIVVLAESVAATNSFVSLQLACSQMDNFDLYVTVTDETGNETEVFVGSQVLDASSPAWNQVAKAQYTGYCVVTVDGTSSLSSYSSITKIRLRIRGYVDATIEIMDVAFTTDLDHKFDIPCQVNEMTTSSSSPIILSENPDGVTVATYSSTPGWNSIEVYVSGYDANLTVLEVKFTLSEATVLCFHMNGQNGGHNEYAAGENTYTVNVSEYGLAGNFVMEIFLDAEAKVETEKTVTFNSLEFKAAE